MKIGIIGAGNVGGALGKGWVAKGHEVKFGVPDPAASKVGALLVELGTQATAGTPAEAAGFGDVVALAVPWQAAQDAVRGMGNLAGKTLLDCTNPIKADFSGLEIGHTTSAGEMVAQWATGANVVKIFNTAGANIMADSKFASQLPAMFYCGDNADAKKVGAQLASELGFAPVDAGPLTQAPLLEAAAWLWITMALKYGAGTDIAFALLKR